VRLWTGCQCNCCKTGEIWSRRPAPVISWAAAFWTDWTLRIMCVGLNQRSYSTPGPVNTLMGVGEPSWYNQPLRSTQPFRLVRFLLLSNLWLWLRLYICVLYFLFNCMLVLFSHFGYNEINIHTYILLGSINEYWQYAGGKGTRITSVGWQVTLCDPIWQVISHAH